MLTISEFWEGRASLWCNMGWTIFRPDPHEICGNVLTRNRLIHKLCSYGHVTCFKLSRAGCWDCRRRKKTDHSALVCLFLLLSVSRVRFKDPVPTSQLSILLYDVVTCDDFRRNAVIFRADNRLLQYPPPHHLRHR